MKLFMPERALFEPEALNYPLGRQLYERFSNEGVEIKKGSVQSIQSFIPGIGEKERYARSKKTVVVTTKKGLVFDVCKPSADYEFSLVTNCPGHCEYCYLQTTQGFKPFLRIYVNLEEIFEAVIKHIHKNGDNITTFEIASSGDPLALEHLTGSVAKTIEFFGDLEKGRLRLVTKYNNVDSLCGLKHNGHTKFRVSLNAKYVIDSFEHNTSSFEERIEAASKIASAGYPIGFIIAPIMIFENWKKEYEQLFQKLYESLESVPLAQPATFELIQHRFTKTAKNFILQRFPNTKLDMEEYNREIKWGKFGRTKYVYPKEQATELQNEISELICKYFPDSAIEYFT